MRIFTVGHSTRSLDELVAILRAHGVAGVADVRRFPASRRHPHFARESLERGLPEAGIDYRWFPGLGGRRSRREASPHTAWRVRGFAAYADHLDSPEFEEAIGGFLAWASERPTALMCAEALPERCHRRLISDWLTARGEEVVHLIDEMRSRRHEIPDFARIEAGRLIYDGGQPSLPG